jgi:hypothetical protein
MSNQNLRFAGVSAGVVLALLTGCSTATLPTPHPVAATDTPVLTEEQNLAVLAAVNATLAEASAQRDATLLAPRVTGPALQIRTSQLQVAQVLGDDSLVTVIPDHYQQLIIPTTQSWPRTAFAITDVTEELHPPRLLALEQATAREPYRLWGWVQLRAGVEMPAFADARIGSQEVAPDDTTLRVTPEEAVNQYADLLTNGGGSAFNENFEPLENDHFRFFLATWVAAQQEALSADRVEGTYSLVVRPSGSGIKAVRSADGGALVMAELLLNERLEAVEGAVLSPQTQTAQALLTGQEFTNVLTAQYRDMIALHVPPAGSGEPIRLLGYNHIQVGATVGP